MIKKFTIHIILATTLLFPVFMYAQPGNTGVINIPNPTSAGSTIMEVLTAILNNVVLPVAAVAVVIWIIYAGFMYVLAQGNPTKIEQAHQRLLWSLIGAGILLGAAGISLAVKNTIEALIRP